MNIKKVLTILFLLSSLVFPIVSTAAPLYVPGETLDPTCLPTDPDCTVTPAAASGANSDITSLDALISATSTTLYVSGLGTFENIFSINATTTNLTTTNFTLGSVNGLLFGTNGVITAVSTTTLLGNYLSTTTAASTYVPFGYASGTFPTFTYASGTFPSFTYASGTFATINSYPSYSYASNTFATYSYASGTFPSFLYASNTFPSFAYASNTYASTTGIIANYIPYTGGTTNVNLGTHDLTVDTTSLFVNSTTHLVGIGTTTPSQKLTVAGNVLFTGNLNIATTSGEYKITDGNYTRLTRTSTNNQANLYNQVSVAAADATGGTITHSGGYTIHTFTSGGTFTPVGTQSVEVLVVAGGGGGGLLGGGGGGGGVVYHTSKSVTGAITVTVGGGGAAGPNQSTAGSPGSDSTFSDITALGGGGGASQGVNPSPHSGGSGGGAGPHTGGAWPGGTATQGNSGGGTGFGNNGGTGIDPTSAGGGGGGAGAVGSNGTTGVGGNGGAGYTSSISGSSVTYAGGGGGGAQGGVGGSGGSGGGGAGTGSSAAAGAGTTNRGGGGGSAGFAGSYGTSGAGGSGIVIVRYLTSATIQEATLVTSQDSAVAGEYGINTFGTSAGATHIAGNAIYLDSSGLNRAIITSNGNFGIGTSSPNALLVVQGTSTSPTNDLFVIASSTNTKFLTVNYQGNLGVGTSTPTDAKLSVYGNSGSPIANFASSTNQSALFIDSAGNIGVGTSAPTAKLYVSSGGTTPTAGKAPTFFVDTGTNLYNAEFKGSGSYTGFLITNTNASGVPFLQFHNGNNKEWTTQVETDNSYAIREDTAAGTQRLVIAVGGNIGIGSSTPSAKLSVTGTAGTSDIFGLASSTNTRLLTVNYQGNLGLGTTTPAQKLVVAGNGYIIGSLNVATSSGEYKITDGNYTRLTRTTTNNQANLYNQVSVSAGNEAVGGTITHSGGYTIHSFTASSTFDSTGAGALTVEALVVAGGGEGGGWQGAGGGAGGVIATTTLSLSAGVHTITVGAGGFGAASNQIGVRGASSSIDSLIVATGGGGGGDSNAGDNSALRSGGSGGGGSNNEITDNGFGIAGQGFNGGLGTSNLGGNGGGGGAGARGGNGAANVGGNGGVGITSSITGASVTYAGGGGGGGATTNGTGGAGGGGNAGATGVAGTNGLGGGGGGSESSGVAGANGGSGIVIIRYLTPASSVQEIALITSQDSALGGEYGINTFSTSTGATHIAGNAIYFDIAGTNKLILNSSGNLGLGTSTPLAKLEVYGTAGNNAIANFASSTNTSVLYLAANGNIGVGTTSPSSKVDIYGTAGTGDIFGISSSSNARLLTVNYRGNLGLGTSTPTSKLDIYGTSGTGDILSVSSSSNTRLFTINYAGLVGIGSSSPTALLSIQGTSSFPTLDLFAISSSTNTQLFTIKSSGNIGIGTTTPATTLVVIGTSTLQDIIPVGPYSGNMSVYSLGASTTRWASVWAQTVNIGTSTWSLAQTGSRFGIFNQANATGTEAISILSNGNVGIGTTTPGSLLTIAGNFSIATPSGEYRITDGNYTRLTRSSTSNQANLYNQVAVLSVPEALGGTITHSGGYTIHTFNASSTFDSTLTGSLTIEALIVGGGGAGGGKTGAGGGAGGFISSSTVTMSAGIYTITVGAGGTSPGSGWGNNGATSTINNITGLIASGGGGGGSNNGGEGNGRPGGSGGGGSGFTGSAGTAGQGNAGGTGLSSGSFATGGGGGSGSVGGNGSGSVAGNGGTGTTSSISGSSVTYACGGGGGTFTGTAGNGGCSSAGNGGSSPTAGTNGFGGGGGGMNGNGGAGAAGGSGIVIIRYLTPASTIQEAALVNSQDSVVPGEVGINTFGTSSGATHIAGNAIYLDIAGTNKLTLDSSGRLGIGTSTPTDAKLSVYGTAGNNAIVNFASSSNLSVFYIGANGRVGIGTTTPSATVSISGTPTTTLLQLVGFGSGSLSTDASGNVVNTSDERLKDIEGNYVRGLADIEQLTPINYRWKAETGLDASTTYSGFSAQNVKSAIPEAIGQNGAGFFTLNDRPIVAALVNAVKEIGSFISKIEGGIAYLKDIVVERFTVGSSEKPTGITMYDEVTGNPYCIQVKNGAMVSEPGVCSTIQNTTSDMSGGGSGSGGGDVSSDTSTSTATSTDQTSGEATSTPDTDNASSTDPIVPPTDGGEATSTTP